MNILPVVPLAGGAVVLVKWSLLLAFGWLAHAALRHGPPRARMILWRTILCTGIGLPFLHLAALPTVEIRVPAPPSIAAQDILPPRETRDPKPAIAPALTQAATRRSELRVSSSRESGSTPSPRRLSRAVVLWSVWALGVTVAMLRLIKAWVHLSRLRRTATADEPSWQHAADEIRGEMRIRVPVLVQSSNAVGAPFVCGLFRPAILLTRNVSLSSGELQALLRHELAHVRRHDIAWHLAWKCMQALCWFHPLIWAVPRAHGLACEQEADRIASGEERDPFEYAERLAHIALQVVRSSLPGSTLALNANAQLVDRLNYLMSRRTRIWTRRHAFLAYALSVFIALVATGWSLAQRHASAAPSPGDAGLGSKELVIVVQDEKGRAVEGAVVQPYAFRVKGPKSVDHYGWDRRNRPRLVTNDKGEVRLSYPVEAFPEEKLFTGQISVTINHPQFTPATAHLPVDGPAQPVRLTRGLALAIIGAGPKAEPVPELSANLSGEPQIVWQTIAPGILMSHQVPPGTHLLQVMGRLASGEIVYSDCFAFTGELGADHDTFRIGGDTFIATEKDKPYTFTVGTRPGIRLEGRLDDKVPRPVKNGRAVISVRPKQIPAYVVPEEGAEFYRQYGAFQNWTSHRPINDDGTFVFESIPPGEVDVVVHGEGFVSKNGGNPHNGPGSSRLIIGVPQAFPLHEPVTRIEVVTEPTATLDVTVKTRSGQPVEGATVYTGPNVMRMRTGYLGGINRSSEAAFRPIEPLSETPSAYSGRTDRNGKVVLHDIPAVAHSLNVEHPDFEVPLPEPGKKLMRDRSVRFELSPGKVERLSITVQPKGTDYIGQAP